MTDRGEATTIGERIDGPLHDEEQQHREPVLDATETRASTSDDTGEHGDDSDMAAFLLDVKDCGHIGLSRRETSKEIARIIDDSQPRLLRLVTGLGLWTSPTRVRVNHGATTFVRLLLRAVAHGDYPASDDEQFDACARCDDPELVPVVSGPALVTGLAEAGQPADLPDAFNAWLTRCVDNERNAARIRAVHGLGLLGVTIIIEP